MPSYSVPLSPARSNDLDYFAALDDMSNPTPEELSTFLMDSQMTNPLCLTLHDKPLWSAVLRQYQFVTISMRRLERELARHQIERTELHSYLFEETEDFSDRIKPLLLRHQRMKQDHRRHHPYGRKRRPSPQDSSSPYSSSPSPPPKSQPESPPPITIEEATAAYFLDQPTPSPPPCAEIRRGPNGNTDSITILPGDHPTNPICIVDDEPIVGPSQPYCVRCGRKGHESDDCDVPLPGDCGSCQFLNQPQESCRHTRITPAWIKAKKAEWAAIQAGKQKEWMAARQDGRD